MNRGHTESPWILDAVWILTLSVLLHLVLGLVYPMIYGGDTILRLVNRDTIFLSYQLPLFQVFLVALSHLSLALIWVRLLMGFLGAAAAFGFYLLTAYLVERQTARVAAFLFCLHPFFLFYSLVPYQESLMLALLFPSVYFAIRFKRENRTSLLVAAVLFCNLACLTRYESWVVAAVLAGYTAFHRFPSKTKLMTTLLFGMAPLAWILWRGGLNPPGSYVLDFGFGIERLYRWYFVLRKAVGGTTSAVSLLAILGFGHWWVRSGRFQRELRLLVWIAAAFLVSLLFSAHNFGDSQVVTEREAHLIIPYLLVPAAWGLLLLMRYVGSASGSGSYHLQGRPVKYDIVWILTLALVAVYSLKELDRRIDFARHQDGLEISFRIARAIERLQAVNGGEVVVFAAPIPESLIADYLDRVEKSQGAEGLREAKETLRQMNFKPLDYQRVLVHCRRDPENLHFWTDLGPDRILSSDAGLRYWVIFSDFEPPSPELIAQLHSIQEMSREVYAFSDAGRSARIYDIVLSGASASPNQAAF